MTQAKSTFGVELYRNGNKVGAVTSIGGVNIELEIEDGTEHDSPGGYREKIGTVLNADRVPIEGHFYPGDSTGQVGMRSDMETKLPQAFEIRYPDAIGASWTFTALVAKFGTGDAPTDGKLTWATELEITGRPELNISSSTGLTPPFFSTDVGSIVPTPAGDAYSYVVYIPTEETEVVITPTASAGVITITANGASQVVTSGNPSSPIALGAAGSVVECTISVKETGKIAKSYKLNLTRAAGA